MPQLSAEDEEALASAPQPGSVFGDKYVIDKVLGIGGMGYVLSARHTQLDEMVAIKMLLPRLTRDPEMVGRFMREGRAAVKIQSEHVARIRDVGSVDGTPYIVMEYLSGTDLAGLLRRETRLETTRAVDYLLQASEAIAEAHALNIVHRDLKPANLFLARRTNGPECIKVLDFGISKMTGPHGSPEMSMTRTSSVLGSPLYMSPEQLTSAKHVDSRTDIWSLGVILFELVAGRVPFLAASLPELGVMVLTGRAPDVRKFAPLVPAGLAAAISACLQHNSEDRFPSVAELARALAPFGSRAAASSSKRIASVLESMPRPRNTGLWETICDSGLDAGESWGSASGALSPDGRAVLAATSKKSSPLVTVAIGLMAAAVIALGARSFLTTQNPGGPAPSSSVLPIATEHALPSAVVVLPVASSSVSLVPSNAVVPHVPLHNRPAPSASHTPAASASVVDSHCIPNFDLDPNGGKHFKPECFK